MEHEWLRAIFGTVLFTGGVLFVAVGLTVGESRATNIIRLAGYIAAALGPAMIMAGIGVAYAGR